MCSSIIMERVMYGDIVRTVVYYLERQTIEKKREYSLCPRASVSGVNSTCACLYRAMALRRESTANQFCCDRHRSIKIQGTMTSNTRQCRHTFFRSDLRANTSTTTYATTAVKNPSCFGQGSRLTATSMLIIVSYVGLRVLCSVLSRVWLRRRPAYNCLVRARYAAVVL